MRTRTIVARRCSSGGRSGLPRRAAARPAPPAPSLGGAASVAPSNAVAFVALDSDVSSGQWNSVDGLLDKFPATTRCSRACARRSSSARS